MSLRAYAEVCYASILVDILFECAYGTLFEDRNRRVVVFQRSAQIAHDIEQFAGDLDRAIARLSLRHRSCGMIIDLRSVAGTNRSEVETVGQAKGDALIAACARGVILVRSEAGALQLRRMMRGRINPPAVVTSEDEAVAVASTGGSNLGKSSAS